MNRKDFRLDITGYKETLEEIKVCRKYGLDYAAEKGKKENTIQRLHPDRLKLKVSEIIEETQFTKTLRLVSPDGNLPPFQAGQYINLFVDIDGIKTSRPYSISSSPYQTAFYDITVARIKEGFVSNYLLDEIKAGDCLESSGPSGNFYYNPLFHGNELLFLAGGSGITPFMSMLRELTDAGLGRRIHLIYGNREPDNILFHNELKEMALYHDNFTYSLVISEPPEGYKGLKGYINKEVIRKVIGDTKIDSFYICGPGAMYDYCLQELKVMGIPGRRIRTEVFSSQGDISKESGWPAEIDAEQEFNVKISGKDDIKAKAGEPLLVALERSGIIIPVTCRSGECSRCRVKLVSGKVFQPAGVLLRETDKKYGYIHSCKAYPLEDLEISL